MAWLSIQSCLGIGWGPIVEDTQDHSSRYQDKDDLGQGDVHGPLALMLPKSSSEMGAPTPPIPNRLSAGKIRNLSFTRVFLRVLLDLHLEKLRWGSCSKTENIDTHTPRKKLPAVCGQLALATWQVPDQWETMSQTNKNKHSAQERQSEVFPLGLTCPYTLKYICAPTHIQTYTCAHK